MKIVGAVWGKKRNYLVIECNCLHRFHHRSDRWKVECPKCKSESNLAELRAKYVDEKEDNA